jgi:hypothetical protein
MSTANLPAAPKTIADYVRSIVESDPSTALEIVLAETERQRLVLQRKHDELRQHIEEQRKMANVEMDAKGQFVARSLAGLMAIGDMYAYSGLVPKHYEEKPGACAIAVQMAARCGVDTFLFMQNTYPVGNKIGMEAKLAIALLNSSGRIKDRITWRFEGEGDKRKCTAIATDAYTGQVIEESVDWEMVVAEGWVKNNKWKSMPDVMFKYRSAAFLARINYPDVLMGMYTMDELEDIHEQRKVVLEGKPVKTLEDLTDKISGNTEQADQSENSPERETKAETAEKCNPEALKDLDAMLAACTTLQSVGECETEFLSRGLTQTQEFALNQACDERREAIRAARGKGSNK